MSSYSNNSRSSSGYHRYKSRSSHTPQSVPLNSSSEPNNELVQQLYFAFQQQQQQLQLQAACLLNIQSQQHNQQYYPQYDVNTTNYQQSNNNTSPTDSSSTTEHINNNNNNNNNNIELDSLNISQQNASVVSIETCEQSIQCDFDKNELESLKFEFLQEQLKNKQLCMQTKPPKLTCDTANQCNIDVDECKQLKEQLAAEKLKVKMLQEQLNQEKQLTKDILSYKVTIDRLRNELNRVKQTNTMEQKVWIKARESMELEMEKLQVELKEIKDSELQLINAKNTTARVHQESTKELQKLRKQSQKSIFSRDDMHQLKLFNSWQKKLQCSFDELMKTNDNNIKTMETRHARWGTHLAERYQAWKSELVIELKQQITTGMQTLKDEYETDKHDDRFDKAIMENIAILIVEIVDNMSKNHVKQTNIVLEECKHTELQLLLETQVSIFKAAIHMNSVQIKERDAIINILSEQLNTISNRK
jgi:hypothetical protein